MDNYGIPIIRLELERTKREISSMLARDNREYDAMIQTAVSKCINAEWFEACVEGAVEEAIRNAIKAMTTDIQLQHTLKGLILDAIEAKSG